MAKFRETLITPADMEKVLGIIQKRDAHQAFFGNAFLQVTGLSPEEAEMCYGEKVVDGNAEFRIWFRRKEEGEELQMLREMFGRVCEHVNQPPLMLVTPNCTKEELDAFKAEVLNNISSPVIECPETEITQLTDGGVVFLRQMVTDFAATFPVLKAIKEVADGEVQEAG